MTDEQIVRRHLRRLKAIRKTVESMTTITYNDAYFMTLRLNKRIDFIKDELGIKSKKKSLKTNCFSHVFKLTDKDIRYLSIDE